MRTILIALTICLTSLAHGAMDKDRGGGNSYRGKPLESYIQNPKELKPYIKHLKDLQAMLNKHDYFDKYFNHALTHKTWYFVPGPLRQLSPKTIGSVVLTEQVALQGFDAVWIDKDLFEKLSISDQANLMLHEILISLKLLRFESMREQCLMLITQSANSYQCDDVSTIRYGTPSDLTPEDYEEVRKTVSDLRTMPNTVTTSEVQNLFYYRHFSFPFYPFRPDNIAKHKSGEEAFEMILSSYLTHSWPSSLFRFADLYSLHPELEHQPLTKPLVWKSQGSCMLDKFTYEQGRMRSHYRSQVEDQAPVDIAIDFAMNPETLYIAGLDATNILDKNLNVFLIGNTMIQQAVPGKRSVGDRFIETQFILGDRDELASVHLTEYVILREGDSQQNGERSKQVRGGIDEICSIRQQFRLAP